jgi:hypothetical protein
MVSSHAYKCWCQNQEKEVITKNDIDNPTIASQNIVGIC